MLHHAQAAAQVLATLADDAAVDAAVTTTQSSGGVFDGLTVAFENILKVGVMLVCIVSLIST
jgi:ABC-type tungstate transport system permease subunit